MKKYRSKGNGIYEAKIVVKTLVVVALLGTLLSLMSSCDNKREPVVPTVNSAEVGTVLNMPPTQWHIVSKERLAEVYQEAGHPIPEGAELYGLTGVTDDGTIVIVTTEPQYVDDAVALTLGHEYMHVALGKYHQPYE